MPKTIKIKIPHATKPLWCGMSLLYAGSTISKPDIGSNRLMNLVSGLKSIDPNSVQCSDDGDRLAFVTGGESPRLFVYDLNAARFLLANKYSHNSVTNDRLSFSPDGKKLYVNFPVMGITPSDPALEYSSSVPALWREGVPIFVTKSQIAVGSHIYKLVHDADEEIEKVRFCGSALAWATRSASDETNVRTRVVNGGPQIETFQNAEMESAKGACAITQFNEEHKASIVFVLQNAARYRYEVPLQSMSAIAVIPTPSGCGLLEEVISEAGGSQESAVVLKQLDTQSCREEIRDGK